MEAKKTPTDLMMETLAEFGEQGDSMEPSSLIVIYTRPNNSLAVRSYGANLASMIGILEMAKNAALQGAITCDESSSD